MKASRIYISGMGVISSLGNDVFHTRDAIQKGLKGIRPISLFSTAPNRPLPVGEVSGSFETDSIPRTHQLARHAADQAMAGCSESPDAVILGVTTGGILTTEVHLENNAQDPELFRYHAVGSVAEDIARRFHCTGPVLTVSTACSSGTVAIKIALEMMRAGLAERVLAGGADSLCRLTYHGFNVLQLIAPDGARPLDQIRRGMTVAEGAAVLLLAANRSENALAEILGAGLSCDAYHPAKPHPQGKGAIAAMQAALKNAGISPEDVDYINLHGTGTPDNDLAEARAIQALFPRQKPLLSSIKGALGHSLAAAGAIEAVVSAISIADRLVPANTGCRLPDPDLKLEPVVTPVTAAVDCVLSNSFGFGGNNAAAILARPGKFNLPPSSNKVEPLAILGYACITGAGNTETTMGRIMSGNGCKGMLSLQEISKTLSPRIVRRLKRLPRLSLALAQAAHENSGRTETPSAVFVGTGWGALSETYDFLTRLFETHTQFPSPTDFVGSVHNAPAGQIALQFQSTGSNITTSGGDCSFEQALLAAHLLSGDIRGSFFVMGADESHAHLSRLLDSSISDDEALADGGGAFCLKREDSASGLFINLVFYENVANNPDVVSALIRHIGGPEKINSDYGALLAGIPAGCRREGEKQLQTFLALSGFKKPVIDYRKITGEFASASAVAAVMAANFLQAGKIPEPFSNGYSGELNGKGILVIGLGVHITGMELLKR
ncbi:beta-ketoacyl-[acyl-carrier-protein] synthase family protein [Thermodesulfobacteriota bacterium]